MKIGLFFVIFLTLSTFALDFLTEKADPLPSS